MLILAIDPGTRTSGVCLYESDSRRVVWSCKALDNEHALALCRSNAPGFAAVVMNLTPTSDGWRGLFTIAVERVQAQGIAGNDVMLTCEWSARFVEAAESTGHATRWHYRREVCRHLDVVGANKDAQVRARAIELHGGDRKVAQGTKKEPGPLHGVSGHSWQALGLALLVADV